VFRPSRLRLRACRSGPQSAAWQRVGARL